MNRLTHSFAGYRRYMQMSSSRVFAFVEGKTLDPHFYGKVCDSACAEHKISYTISRAQEIPGQTGGKLALVALFKYLRSRNLLINTFKGKMTISIFYLDKDIDDILRKKCRSQHVVYTQYYDVENHLFKEGNLHEAIAAAAAAAIDLQTVKSVLGSNENWCQKIAVYWKEWITLCLFASKYKIRCECSYSRNSQINTRLIGPVDEKSYNSRRNILLRGSGLSDKRFKRAFSRIKKMVDRIYRDGQQDLIFKGKWYATLMAEEMREVIGTVPFRLQNLPDRLSSCMALTLDFNKEWAKHFIEPLMKIIKQSQSHV